VYRRRCRFEVGASRPGRRPSWRRCEGQAVELAISSRSREAQRPRGRGPAEERRPAA